MKNKTILVSILFVFILLLTACAKPIVTPVSQPPATEPASQPATTEPAVNQSTTSQPVTTILDGKTIMENACSVCHSLDRVTSKHGTLADWQATVSRMINHGAVLTSEEETVLLQYLAATYK
jgi:cytochrome c5